MFAVIPGMNTLAERVEHRIPAGDVELLGELTLPEETAPVVVFAHGSGSSRLSPRNQFVAQALRDSGLGTLLFDLLTAEEEELDFQTGRLRFDIAFLAQRLERATAWLAAQRPDLVSVGYFGASTGAAAALLAAARAPGRVGAIVSRGGRPDLAGDDALARVSAPTLLIVGGNDRAVLPVNEAAFAALRGEKRIHVVPGATHLFEEPGALEEVAREATAWFGAYLLPRKRGRGIP